MKKLLSILLALMLLSTSVVTSFAVASGSTSKLTSNVENDPLYKKLQKALNKKYEYMGSTLEEYVKITLYKKLSDKRVLFNYELLGNSKFACMVYDEYIGKYNYRVGSVANLAYIFDGKKIYDIKDAYNDDIIGDKELDKTAKILKEMKVAKLTVKAGEEDYLSSRFSKNSYGEISYSKKNIASVDSIGNLTGLKKGKTTITATPKVGKKYSCKIVVTSNPKLKIKGKTISAKKTYTVKKGKCLNVKISGKAKDIKNKYTNTEYAKIISKKSDDSIKVKGLKKGTTAVKIKVNGVKTLKLRVRIV
ncbi:MAG: Ig-like domain-containing protein [Ruminococcus sp.]